MRSTKIPQNTKKLVSKQSNSAHSDFFLLSIINRRCINSLFILITIHFLSQPFIQHYFMLFLGILFSTWAYFMLRFGIFIGCGNEFFGFFFSSKTRREHFFGEACQFCSHQCQKTRIVRKRAFEQIIWTKTKCQKSPRSTLARSSNLARD